jgi:hypothetical protein
MGFALWLWFAAVFFVLALGTLLSSLMSGGSPRRALRRWFEQVLDIISFGVVFSLVA